MPSIRLIYIFVMFFFLLSISYSSEIKLLNGEKKTGSISYAANYFNCIAKGKKESYRSDSLLSVQFPENSIPKEHDFAVIELINATRIVGHIRGKNLDGSLDFLLNGEKKIAIKMDLVASITFNPVKIATKNTPGEGEAVFLMVNGENITAKINFFTSKIIGIIKNGRKLRLKKERLAKIYFKNSIKPKLLKGDLILKTVFGDVVYGQLKEIKSNIALIKCSLLEHSYSVNQLKEIELISPQIVSLLDLKPKSIDEVPFLDFIHKTKFNESLFGTSLVIDGFPIQKGFSSQSSSILKYSIAQKYSSFLTVVDLDERYSSAGDAIIQIKGDGKLLKEIKLKSADKAKNIFLSVVGISELDLIVDYGSFGSSGDYVIWGNPRLIVKSTPK